MEIKWIWRTAENNTIEGWIGAVFYFDIELKEGKEEVVLYQMKKPVGNFKDFPNLATAKEFCNQIKPIK